MVWMLESHYIVLLSFIILSIFRTFTTDGLLRGDIVGYRNGKGQMLPIFNLGRVSSLQRHRTVRWYAEIL